MKIQATIDGNVVEGEAALVANIVTCGGSQHSGVEVTGFSDFLNEAIAYAINEGSALFDTIGGEDENDDVPWKVSQATSKEIDELRLGDRIPAPGTTIVTEDGYRFTVVAEGTSFGDGDLTFYSLSEIGCEYAIGQKFAAAPALKETLVAMGFSLISTGGGCEAWEFEHGGYYVWLTDSNGSDARELTEEDLIWMGYYKSNQDHSDEMQLLEAYWKTGIMQAVQEFKDGAWQSRQPDAGDQVGHKVAQAGELLIRAAAVLGTLTPEQLEQLRQATDGALPDSIGFALKGAAIISDEVRNSLKTHPPKGFGSL